MIVGYIAKISFNLDEDSHSVRQANNGKDIVFRFEQDKSPKVIAENVDEVKILLKKHFNQSYLANSKLNINDFDLTFYGWYVHFGSLFEGWDKGKPL